MRSKAKTVPGEITSAPDWYRHNGGRIGQGQAKPAARAPPLPSAVRGQSATHGGDCGSGV